MIKTCLFLIFLVALLLVNCSKAVLSNQYPMQSLPPPAQESDAQDMYLEESATKEKSVDYDRELSIPTLTNQSAVQYKKREKDAEVVGYLDNPTPFSINESRGSAGSFMLSGKPKAAIQQLAEWAPVQQKGKARPERLVTYDASIVTRSHRPDSIIERAIALTNNFKGFVEERHNTSVTLRIPSARFDTVFNTLLKIGEIVNFHKSAEDITDAFQDANQRIQILGKTIERYLKLVTQVKEEAEKIKLLKEIETLREELENLEVRKKSLALRAEYAKIIFSVQAVIPQSRGSMAEEIAGFEWVHRLDPFNISAIGKQLEYAIPTGMLAITVRGLWFVESADGSKVWSSRLTNEPEGSARFWIDAIRERLGSEFYAADTSSAQGYEFIRFTPFPGSNYVYTVGIAIKDGSIHVLQAYFPDENQEKRYLQAIRDILGKERS
jgi:hypothetical protein